MYSYKIEKKNILFIDFHFWFHFLGHNGNGNLTPDEDLPADVDDEVNDIDERRSDSSNKSEVNWGNFFSFPLSSLNSFLYLFYDFVETTWSEI